MENTQLKELFESISSDILTDEVKLQIGTIFETTVQEAVEERIDVFGSAGKA